MQTKSMYEPEEKRQEIYWGILLFVHKLFYKDISNRSNNDGKRY